MDNIVTPQSHQKQIEHLVLEGGGVRGIAFAGTLQRLEELGILKNIKKIAGSSAGAFVAIALAVGYTPNQIYRVLAFTDFNQFRDSGESITFPLFKKIKNIFFSYGIYRGDALYEWLGELIKAKTGNADITFQEVHQKYGYELVLTGTNLNKAKTVFFHHLSYPKMPIRLAARISGSLPLVYVPIYLKGDLFIDGGFLSNYPIWVFDQPDAINNMPNHHPTPKTLGIKLMEPDIQANNTLFHGKLNTDKFHNYCMSLLECMMVQIEKGHIMGGYWERTVTVSTHHIKTTDFSISREEKDLLYWSGYTAVDDYFNSSKYYQQLYRQCHPKRKVDYKRTYYKKVRELQEKSRNAPEKKKKKKKRRVKKKYRIKKNKESKKL